MLQEAKRKKPWKKYLMYLRARVCAHVCIMFISPFHVSVWGPLLGSSLLNSAYSNLDLAYTSFHAPSTGTRIYLYVVCVSIQTINFMRAKAWYTAVKVNEW